MNRTFAVAVKCVVIHNEKVLLLEKTVQEHEGDLATSKLDLPGGRVNFGEQLEDAVARELYEETGLKAFEINIADAWSIVRPDNTNLVILLYKCRCNNDTITLSNEHKNYWWIPYQDLPNKGNIPDWIKRAIAKR